MAKKKKAPSLGASFNDIRADYEMSRESRFVRRRTGLAPQGGTADYHYRNEAKYYDDIEKARDMDRNDCVVGQTITRAVDNIVQGGFSLDPQTGDKKLDQDLWQRWQDWSNSPDCDIAGEMTFQDIEHQVMRSTLLDGDIVALGLESGELQLIEAHAIQNSARMPNTFLGVTIDDYRRREKYWVLKDANTPNESKATKADPVDVRDENGNRQLFHIYDPKRSTQTRGITAFAPIMQLAGMFEDIQFAKLVQQQVVSCFAIFRQQAVINNGGSPPSTVGYGNGSVETTLGGTRYIEDITPGMEVVGAPGETLQGFSPNVPNAEFFNHVKLMLQLIGVNLGLPLCLVLMDGSETNFSGWRGAVDEARKGFKRNQTNLANRFHKEVYRWKLRQWSDEDPALGQAFKRLGSKVFNHKWNCPTWQYIDPVGDAQGDALRITNSLISPRRLHAEGGRDWEEVAGEIVEDNAYAISRAKMVAKRINKKYDDGAPVHWRELISLPMPAGTQMTMSDPNAQKEAPANE